jgi:hypothetical protein
MSVTCSTVRDGESVTPLVQDDRMNTPNVDSMDWHPASGRSRRRRHGNAEIVDLATERAKRLLSQAGMIRTPAATQRRGTVR